MPAPTPRWRWRWSAAGSCRELRLEFSFHRYADRIAEVRDHVRDDWIGASIDDEALERAARLQGSEPGARLRIREQIGIGRLRPIRR